jgi:hypothetical protein
MFCKCGAEITRKEKDICRECSKAKGNIRWTLKEFIHSGKSSIVCTKCHEPKRVTQYYITPGSWLTTRCVVCVGENTSPDWRAVTQELVDERSEQFPTNAKPPKGILPKRKLDVIQPAPTAEITDQFLCTAYKCKLSYRACILRRGFRIEARGRTVNGRYSRVRPADLFCAFECKQGEANAQHFGIKGTKLQRNPWVISANAQARDIGRAIDLESDPCAP